MGTSYYRVKVTGTDYFKLNGWYKSDRRRLDSVESCLRPFAERPAIRADFVREDVQGPYRTLREARGDIAESAAVHG